MLCRVCNRTVCVFSRRAVTSCNKVQSRVAHKTTVEQEVKREKDVKPCQIAVLGAWEGRTIPLQAVAISPCLSILWLNQANGNGGLFCPPPCSYIQWGHLVGHAPEFLSPHKMIRRMLVWLLPQLPVYPFHQHPFHRHQRLEAQPCEAWCLRKGHTCCQVLSKPAKGSSCWDHSWYRLSYEGVTTGRCCLMIALKLSGFEK